jgi:hydroxyacylglutathione hydrolase
VTAAGATARSTASSAVSRRPRARSSSRSASGSAACTARRDDERAGGRITGSQGIPLHELPDRLAEVPAGRPVWVHCAAGYRASIAASLLARAGRDVVLVDDEFAHAAAAGLPMTGPPCPRKGAGPDSGAPRPIDVRRPA